MAAFALLAALLLVLSTSDLVSGQPPVLRLLVADEFSRVIGRRGGGATGRQRLHHGGRDEGTHDQGFFDHAPSLQEQAQHAVTPS
ncbi:hypothetical protein [Actinomadura decatromicini]|uniref:hypothetical protein n=1 Tax=Actinomadura decatromicini TaxID=2604572 RepID=UPI001CA33E10|nr:hypothetical protein [Actinomadura decatromicini]